MGPMHYNKIVCGWLLMNTSFLDMPYFNEKFLEELSHSPQNCLSVSAFCSFSMKCISVLCHASALTCIKIFLYDLICVVLKSNGKW